MVFGGFILNSVLRFSFGRYERGLSVLQGWLDSSENLCKTDTPYLIMDKAKLHSQLQTLQVSHKRSFGSTVPKYFYILSFDINN